MQDVPVLTDGLAEVDAARAGRPPSFWKTRREASFPLAVIEAALQVDVSKGQATQAQDRTHILNAIAGQPMEQEPLDDHPNYDMVTRYCRAADGAGASGRSSE